MKALFPLLFLLGGLAWGQGESIERYALFAGSNVGGKGTTPLKYATGDAKQFQQVLTKLGGLKEENSLLLVNPARENLLQGLGFLQSKVRKNRQPQRQSQLVFYYSGHSDSQGLLLNGERLAYQDLKAELKKVDADVQLVVLDSCSSGAFTRTKGGAITAPFMLDVGTEVEGHAFLTSSTAEELSQESDRIESSFFTHALVEGLRGAADANADGKVTLNEAYEYAYAQTTAETQATQSGTQHPAYDIQLNGKGNLVLTDLRMGGATLILSPSMEGSISVRDISNKLVAEVQKTAGQELVLGLEEGYYRVGWATRGTLYESTMLVDEKRAYALTSDQFKLVDKTANRTRGTGQGSLSWVAGGILGLEADGTASFSYNLLSASATELNGPMISLFGNRLRSSSSGFQGSIFANDADEDYRGLQASFGVNLVNGDMSGVQTGLLYNFARRIRGLQLAAINSASELRVGQLGLINTLGNGNGYQIGIVNSSRSLEGLQVGLINASQEQTGVQIGLINISKKLNGLPIGLIDIQMNGQNHIDQTLGFTGHDWDSLDQNIASNTLLRFGSDYFYKYLSFGTRIAATSDGELPTLSLGMGLGIRAPVFFPGFALHIDGGTAYQRRTPTLDLRFKNVQAEDFVPQFRTFASWAFYQNYGLLLGWEYPVYTKYFHSGFSTTGKAEIKTEWGNLYVANRFFLGIQL